MVGCDASAKLDYASETEIMTVRKKKGKAVLGAKSSPSGPDPEPIEDHAKIPIDFSGTWIRLYQCRFRFLMIYLVYSTSHAE